MKKITPAGKFLLIWCVLLLTQTLAMANQLPVVKLTSPTVLKYSAPANIYLLADASDADGSISKVEFFNGSTLLKTEHYVPYEFHWDSVAAGTYTITAKVTDNQGGTRISAPVTVTVGSNLQPTVTLTSPKTNLNVTDPGEIYLSATATDPDGTIKKVEFYSGSTLLKTENYAPYEYQWSSVPAGSYSIKAIAYDNMGATATSTVALVKVTSANTASTTSGTSIPAFIAKRKFYVSNSDPASSDTNPGTIDQPWRTLDKVNSFVRSSAHAPGDWILFKAGDTFNGNLIVGKSGTSADRIVYGAYGTGTKPIISGFKTITSWTSAGNGIYYAPLDKDPNTVLFNGVLRGKGRMPSGQYNFYRYESANDSAKTITDNDLSGSPSWVGATAVIHTGGTQWQLRKVVAQSGGTLTLDTGDSYNPGFAYFFQNHMRCLTQLGDWMYNDSSKRIYMYFGSNTPSNYTVKANSTDECISCSTKAYVIISDLIAEGATNNGITLANECASSIVQNCESRFNYQGFSSGGVTNCVLRGNYIHDCPSKGISGTSGSTGYLIEGNTLENIGMIHGAGATGNASYVGIYFEKATGLTLRRNRIINIGYQPIRSPRGNNTLIEENYIQSYGWVKDDNGAIGFWQGTSDPVYTNRIVRRNIIVDGRPESSASASNARRQSGLYADIGSDNIVWEGNIVVDTYGYGFFDNMACKNQAVTDNIFFNVSRAGIRFENYDSAKAFRGLNVSGNVVVLEPGRPDDYAFSTRTYSDDVNLYGTISGNIYFTEKLNPFGRNLAGKNQLDLTLSQWQTKYGVEQNSKWASDLNANLSVAYNETPQDKTFSFIGKTYKDVKTGALYKDSITIQPFHGVVLQFVGP